MVYPYITMALLAVLFPQVRAEVLRLLFADGARELHLRELTRQSRLTLGTMQGELEKLCTLDFHFKEVNTRFKKLGL